MTNVRALPYGHGHPSEDLARVMPFASRIDSSTGPGDVVDMLLLVQFAMGSQPWCRSTTLQRVRPGAPLLPDGAKVIREVRAGSRTLRLATGDGWTLHSIRWKSRMATVTVTATSDEIARAVLAAATAGAVEPPKPNDDTVTMGFWHGGNDVMRRIRSIRIQPWEAIRGNYAGAVASNIDQLMAIDAEAVSGRLLLLHGPPGTGKTTVLRALAHAWRDWCQVDCVLDPERLFNDPTYLLDVMVSEDGLHVPRTDGEPGGGDGAGDEADVPDGSDGDGDGDAPAASRKLRWRLLILEDCDELIRAEAKQSSGQALSRLLNLTDGLLGQGADVLIAITTNEELSRLHPAVARPGRRLAEIEVGRLSRAEATAWLGRSTGIGPEGATLAELFQLRDETAAVKHPPEPPLTIGQYL